MKKFYKIRNDIMFKSIFCKEENRCLLEALIKEVIGEDVKVISLKVPELTKDKVYIKGKTLDVLVRTKDKEINIEINTIANTYLRRRNAAYIFKRYSDSVEVGSSYTEMTNFIQINLTANLSYEYPGVCKYMMYDQVNNLTFIDNLSIYEINVAKFKDLCYNDKKPSMLAMLDMNLDELLNIRGDKLMEKLKKEAINLNNDEDFVKFLDDETEDRLLVNTFIDIGKKEGKKQHNIEIVKKMLQENIDIDLISKITNLSIQEIKKINDEL